MLILSKAYPLSDSWLPKLPKFTYILVWPVEVSENSSRKRCLHTVCQYEIILAPRRYWCNSKPEPLIVTICFRFPAVMSPPELVQSGPHLWNNCLKSIFSFLCSPNFFLTITQTTMLFCLGTFFFASLCHTYLLTSFLNIINCIIFLFLGMKPSPQVYPLSDNWLPTFTKFTYIFPLPLEVLAYSARKDCPSLHL